MMPSERRARTIIAATAAAAGLQPRDLYEPGRFRHIVAARWTAIRAIRSELPTWSAARIGRLMNQDHTTILYALGQTARAKRRPGWRKEEAV